MLSHPDLNFYQVPSKYSKGYLRYKADMKSISNKTKGDNSISKKARIVILVDDTSSHPVLHFYQILWKYSEGYLSYRADMKSVSKTKHREITVKVRKPEMLLLHTTHWSTFLLSTIFLPSIIKIFQMGIWLTEMTQKQYLINVKYNKGR